MDRMVYKLAEQFTSRTNSL